MKDGRYTMLDPTAGLEPSRRTRLAPPRSLAQRTVGLLDIAKERSDEFLDRIEQQFVARGLAVRRLAKPTYTRPAPEPLLQSIVEQCDVVVAALADCGSCTSCTLHDLAALDRRGVAGCAVVTDAFREAVAAQCAALGVELAVAWVPHPIQGLASTELTGRADAAVAAINRLIEDQRLPDA
jgi:hypothetical protein